MFRAMFSILIVLAITISAAAELTIVAFGDSTTAPRTVNGQAMAVYADVLGSDLAESGINASVVNSGKPGNRTDQALKRLNGAVLQHDPDYVVIQYGLNDAAVDVWDGKDKPRVGLKKYTDNLREIVRELHKNNIRVILMTPNPMFWTAKLKEMYGASPYDIGDRWGMNVLVSKYAQAVRDLARDCGTGFIDVYSMYEAYDMGDGHDAPGWLLDGIHPNEEAHAELSKRIAEEIAELEAINDRKQIDLFVSGEHNVHTFRIPAITLTAKGTILAVSDARVPSGRDLPNNIDLVLRRSEDMGETWSGMQVIKDYPGMAGGGDSALLTDRDTGRVWLFYVYTDEGIGIRNSKPGLTGDTMQLQLMWSDDDGHTWQGPRSMNESLKDPAWLAGWSSPGCGYQDRDGNLYFPFSRRIEGGLPFTQFALSRDHGETWSTIGPAGEDTNESMIVQRSDGALVANMRNNHGSNRRAIAISTDSGKTWQPSTHDETLIEPVCSAAFTAYDGDDGPVWFFSNPASIERRNMTARFSFDEGKTWKTVARLHYGPSAYSAAVPLPDGRVAVLYERGVDRPYEFITFTTVDPAEAANAEAE